MLRKFSSEIYLVIAALVLLSGMLGAHGIWTQEYRWQQVCLHMLATHDYWHPYLDGKPYYDKPLLSYWMIVGLAKLNHGVLTNTLLRLPSVFSSFIVLACTYWLGKFYQDRKTGLLAAWLLLTTFYFVFWARVASADMWNVAAILLAVVWYLKIEAARVFWRDLIFFLILAAGALLKGLIAPALVFIILLPGLRYSWKSFLNMSSCVAAFIALGVYFAPFMISSMTGNHYVENGLVEVFRENILRFFQPFDHEGPWWTYFLYLPIYSLPWIFLLLIIFPKGSGVLWGRLSASGMRSTSVQGCIHSVSDTKDPRTLRILGTSIYPILSIFIFLSLSGSRRSYYILPIVPFVMIWLSTRWQKKYGENVRVNRLLAYAIAIIYMVLWVNFLILQPYYYLHHPDTV